MDPLLLVSTGAFILAAALMAWTLASVWTEARSDADALAPLEFRRRERLRAGSTSYRRWEPLVDELSSWNRGLQNPARLNSLREAFVVANEPLAWRPEEYVSLLQIEGVMIGILMAMFLMILLPLAAAVLLGIVTAWLWQALSSSSFVQRAAARKEKFKRRLPFAVDLMALMLEAGAGVLEAFESVAKEHREHPMGDEIGEVVRNIQQGLPRSEALRGLDARMKDQDIAEFVFSINKGEELGTPLSSTLRIQADQLRLKRSQWGEKAAAEAQVRIVFPGMLVMIACLLVIVAPFLIPLFTRPMW